MAQKKISVLIRSEVLERNTINVVMPLKGEAVISNQGKEIKVTTLSIAGSIPNVKDCSSLQVYGKEVSGEVNASLTTQKFAGTPYETNILVCMGE